MPWTQKQHNLAEFVAHNPGKARAEGISMTPAAATKMAAEGVKGKPLAHAMRSRSNEVRSRA